MRKIPHHDDPPRSYRVRRIDSDRAWALPLRQIVASIYGANAPTGVGVLTVPPSTGAIASSSTIPVPDLANPGTLIVGIAVDALGEIFVTASNSP